MVYEANYTITPKNVDACMVFSIVSFPDRLSSVSLPWQYTKSDPCWGWLGLGPRLGILLHVPIIYYIGGTYPSDYSMLSIQIHAQLTDSQLAAMIS